MVKILNRKIRVYFQEIDKTLFFSVSAMLLFSLINIYGILGSENQFFIRHLIYTFVGLFVMIFISLFDYRYLKNYSSPSLVLYLVSIVLLILTFFSRSVRGTNAWIIVGGFTFEPSEIAKLILIILMAKYFSQRHVHINNLRNILVSGLYFAIPMAIVMNQPDLGSGIILTAIWVGMLLAVGINKKHLFVLILMGVVASYVAWLFLLQPYQKDRIMTFINPGSDPRGSGYNIIQSKIAIGSGFWLGSGVGNGSQSKLGFLPEPHNDFAFSSAIEQFGFLGGFGILGLIFMIVWRILNIGSRSVNNFGKLFAIGMSIFIFSHAFVSASVNTGLMPVTGIPFSLLSYGGSHLIAIMIGIGILQSIKRYG